MGKILKPVFIGLAVLIVVVAAVALRFLNVTGGFNTLNYRSIASCNALALPGAAEDIQVDHASGIAYLSVFDRRTALHDSQIVGTILKLDLNQPNAAPQPATAGDPPGFRPHGLSLWAHADEPKRLFVVNHPLDAAGHEQQTVEIFEQQADQLFHHVKTVSDALFVHPNDLAAVGPEQFYAANDSGAHNGFTRMIEFLFQPGWSTVVYYDGTKAAIAVSGRAMANGVMASADGLKLYLAETAGRQVLIFDRDTQTGSLYWSGLIEVPGGPDNLDLAEDGSLWVAAHPNTWAVMQHVRSGKPAPTMILRLASPVGGFTKPESVYVNDGTQISVGSVGASYRGRLLIGSFMDKQLLTCPLLPGAR
jgi:arylesterase/paraoxonase